MRFWKTESVGNDFVLVHKSDAPADLDAMAIRVCERRFGVGSDGLLVVEPVEADTVSLRMFNPDGSEDFCGNGIRCAILHARSQGWCSGSVTIVHGGRRVTGEFCEDAVIRFQLDVATYDPASIPLASTEERFDTSLLAVDGVEYRGSVLSTGTAHTVIPVPQLPGDEEFFRVSPQIEHDSLFPKRTSVMWAEELGDMRLRLRIWERGAGETLGCGTGSTATAIDYLRRTGMGGRVEVINPGGTLFVEADDWQRPPTLYGEAKEIYQGELPGVENTA
jgi:diaminopimelate epimerase